MTDVYENVFEAIRAIKPHSPLLGAKSQFNTKKTTRVALPPKTFELIELLDGTIGAFPPGIYCDYYRGEPEVYESCSPSLLRIHNEEDRIIAMLKCIEFELDIQRFPQVEFAKKDYCNVDYIALAQHYGLKTDYIDITSQLEIAAFFATQQYIGGDRYVPKKEGIGVIKVITYILNPFSPMDNTQFKLIGLQPFLRPGRQAAFAIKLQPGEKLLETASVKFKQNSTDGMLVNYYFRELDGKRFKDNTWLFPKEEIVQVVERISESKAISSAAVKLYCERENMPYADIEKMLKEKGLHIAPTPVYKLSKAQYDKMKRIYKERPYGDVELKGRLIKL